MKIKLLLLLAIFLAQTKYAHSEFIKNSDGLNVIYETYANNKRAKGHYKKDGHDLDSGYEKNDGYEGAKGHGYNDEKHNGHHSKKNNNHHNNDTWANLFTGRVDENQLVVDLDFSLDWLVIPNKYIKHAFAGILEDVDLIELLIPTISGKVKKIFDAEISIRIDEEEILTAMGTWKKKGNNDWHLKKVDEKKLAMMIKGAIAEAAYRVEYECEGFCVNPEISVPNPASVFLMFIAGMGFYRKKH